jgi:hypothetical protein
VWGAINPETGVSYLYHEYYRSQAEPVIHAAGIKAVGDWIPGVEDPSCLGSTPVDGRSTMEMLTDLGLDVQPAVKAVETGLYEVWGALSTGHLKVFDTLPHWTSEFRQYHRDEKGRIVKKDDRLMDAMRYWRMSGRQRATARQPDISEELLERLRRGVLGVVLEAG